MLIYLSIMLERYALPSNGKHWKERQVADNF